MFKTELCKKPRPHNRLESILNPYPWLFYVCSLLPKKLNGSEWTELKAEGIKAVHFKLS
jgi:hypothetical protein